MRKKTKNSSQAAQHLLKSPAAQGGRMLTGNDVGWVPESLALRARSLPATRRLPSDRAALWLGSPAGSEWGHG